MLAISSAAMYPEEASSAAQRISVFGLDIAT
jgi:hypothetical protein